MKRILLLIGLLTLSAPAWAQNVFTPQTNVSGLPTAAIGRGYVYMVKDGASSADCTVGGGSNVVFCTSDGTSWSAQALGTGSIVPNSVAGANYLPTSTAANTAAWEQINGGASCGDAAHATGFDATLHKFNCQTLAGTGGPPAGQTIQYAATWGNDSNDGLTWGTAKLTWDAACEALLGGHVSGSTHYCGHGTIYINDGIYANSNTNFGIWIMGPGDAAAPTATAGWENETGAIQTICRGGQSGFDQGGSVCGIGGGNSTDTWHPGLWMDGNFSSFTFNGVQWLFQGVNTIFGFCQNHTNGCGASNINIDTVRTQPQAGAGSGPGWLIGSNVLWLHVTNFSIAGNTTASGGITADAAAAVLVSTNGFIGSGDLHFTEGIVINGGFQVDGGGGSANQLIIDKVGNDNATGVEALFWEKANSGNDTISINSLPGVSDCFAGHCYTVRNDTAFPITVTNSWGVDIGPVQQFNNPQAAGTVFTPPVTIGNVYGTTSATRYRAQTDAAARVFTPVVVPATSLMPTSLNGISVCGTCTLTTGVTDPSLGTQAVQITDTNAGGDNITFYNGSSGGAVANDTFLMSLWVRPTVAGNCCDATNVGLGILDVGTGGNACNGGTPQIKFQVITSTNAWEHYIAACKLTAYPNPTTITMQVGVGLNQGMQYAFPQLILMHGFSDDDVAEIALNLGSWNSSCAPGQTCDVKGGFARLNTAQSWSAAQNCVSGCTWSQLPLLETTAPSAVSGEGILYADSSTHKVYLSQNGGGFQPLNFGTQSVSTGGTGQTALTAHALVVGAGTSAVALVGPDASTIKCLISAGVSADPSFQACPSAGSASWDTISAAAASSTTNNADFAMRYNIQGTTASRVGWLFSENAASTSTGTPVLFKVSTLATSTMNPFQFDSNGNGVRMDINGRINAVGTGSFNWAALSNFPSACSNQFARAVGATLTCSALLNADANFAAGGGLPTAQGGTATVNLPVKRLLIRFAGCNAGTAAPSFDIPASGGMAYNCKTDGSNGTVQGVLSAAASSVAYVSTILPDDFVSFNSAKIWFTTIDATNGHTVIFNVATACTQPNNGTVDTPSYNSANAFTTTTIGGGATANALYSTSAGTVTGTGCSAGYMLHLKFSRSGSDTSTDTAIALTGDFVLAYNGSYQ